jgi:hypothetical protein
MSAVLMKLPGTTELHPRAIALMLSMVRQALLAVVSQCLPQSLKQS